MLRLIFFACVWVGRFSACDLNHDWKVEESEARALVSTGALGLILKDLAEQLGGRLMLLQLRDTYARKGLTDLDGAQAEKRSTEEVDILEKELFGALPEKGLEILGRDASLPVLSSIYDAEGLGNLAHKAGLSAYLRVRLNHYLQIKRQAKDAYEHNPNVYRNSVEHQIGLSYALIGPGGQYLSFGDFRRSYEEFRVFEKLEKKEMTISEAKIQEKEAALVQTDQFFGLEEVQARGQWLAELIESEL